MKLIKIIITTLVLAIATPAFADNQVIDTLIGGVAGGAVGNQIGGGKGKKAATVAGALAGAWLGSTVGDDSERRHRENLRAQAYQTSAQRKGYYAPQQYEQVEYVEAAPVQTRVQRQVVYAQPASYNVPAPAPRFDCDYEYYRGEYDPEMATSYCRGLEQRARSEALAARREKERAMQAAYQAGLQGQ